MYFDPRPKTKKEDLFNRETELKKFEDSLAYASIIVVTGLRRTGKTSFVDVALAYTKHPFIFLDMRDLPIIPSRAEIIRKIETAFNRMDKKWLSTFTAAVKHIQGVSFAGASITFDWGKKGVDLSVLFDEIDEWAKKHNEHFLLAMDEVQLIRGDRFTPRLLARIADTNHNIVIVVTGSEVGLLYDFLGFDDPDSPLFGRHFVEIKMSRFSAMEARLFLEAGFKQVEIPCGKENIDYAIQKLDGVAGWLTLFGVKSRDINSCNKQTVDEVLHDGGKLARTEALKITKFSPRYAIILNFLANNQKASWKTIKTTIEVTEKKSIQNATVTDLLNKLVKTSLVEKENKDYSIADSLLAYGIQKEPL